MATDVWIKCLVIGASGGLLAGLLGVGGGLIMVPLLMIWLKLDVHTAKTQSLAIIMITSVTGTWKSSRDGNLLWPTILACGLAAALMSPIGVEIGNRVNRDVLTRLFACFLLICGIKYLVPTPSHPATNPPAATQSSR